MKDKINVAELLKDCPQGMKLDCTCADNVVFDKTIEYEQIKCVIGECRDPLILDKYGRLLYICCPKCVIFPKGKTTWEGFQRPFMDGDIIVSTFGGIHIMQNSTTSYCYLDRDFKCLDKGKTSNVKVKRFATEEEKQKLFDAIKANGYKWNEETKTLEKLIEPKFKVGDRIQDKDSYEVTIIEVNIEDEYYGYQSVISKGIGGIRFNEQDEWELVPNKFDISTLKPFDKVLGRTNDNGIWECDLFSCYNDSELLYKFHCIGVNYRYCIPYNGNEHLLGKTDDCDDYYKTWEE